ncbi:hypothetical protein IFM12275_47270 [Nocardia sputorum]|uniref:Cadherin-like beta sandwich domain-containing protein n=2 Tax=Nocardiaceae TaxID=85025 RepID=A0ABN6U9Q9_9NOCA|nr:hypothetical protein IFM12275_47270 [Nocardia sputorum]BDU01997.1 hypothetical protein IFM12276_50250 [Nocardia sputorum]
MPMTASRLFRSLVGTVPAVLAVVSFTAAGGVSTAQAAPGIPGVPGVVQRLQIAPGQNSTEATGNVAQGKSDSYSIATAPGQRLSFDVSGNARVSVAPLIGPQVANEVPHADLVADGNDYQIVVSSADGGAAGYTLKVTLV